MMSRLAGLAKSHSDKEGEESAGEAGGDGSGGAGGSTSDVNRTMGHVRPHEGGGSNHWVSDL